MQDLYCRNFCVDKCILYVSPTEERVRTNIICVKVPRSLIFLTVFSLLPWHSINYTSNWFNVKITELRNTCALLTDRVLFDID